MRPMPDSGGISFSSRSRRVDTIFEEWILIFSVFTTMENLLDQSLRCGRSSFPARFSSRNRISSLRWLQPLVELSNFRVSYLRSRRRPPPVNLQNRQNIEEQMVAAFYLMGQTAGLHSQVVGSDFIWQSTTVVEYVPVEITPPSSY
ncbi:unnamed protein product [Citrullus colocynthis]|uniref:Uncharacterized protein n=1 Tax=Citrullus colocynthis TaxID=252529 RepID=A0ABP0YY57_9ROSI